MHLSKKNKEQLAHEETLAPIHKHSHSQYSDIHEQNFP